MRATAKAGFKMPRIKRDEEIVAFRPAGHTSLISKSKNYNFELSRQTTETNKRNLIIAIVAISMIPIAIFVSNAEDNFRRAEVKKIAEKRRIKLDKEHGIDRDQIFEDYDKLDRMYRVTEKEEIGKYLEIGKTPTQYYQEQERRGLTSKT